MDIYSYLIQYWLELAAILVVGVLFITVMYTNNLISKSFGYAFLRALLKAKLLSQKGFIILEIKHRSGAREFKTVKQSPVIYYTIKENKKEKQKVVFYDSRAVDYINSIPILSVTPNEVRPIDRETGLMVNIPGEMIDKLAKDNAMDYESKENYQKVIKQFIWGIGVVAVVFLLAISYMYGNVSDLTAQVIACERVLAESATIVGG